ncbi:J domain-containing protein [Pararhodospirillum oryzae]|uniref:Molecular chaperone DnaJ n=1 Tax=Pararhodospirillum oryzae TaxID=478448 RepID=A0A512H4E8_9PROT|nr:J domain-containing protein [Pararhodospirillum oryzae]GEO80322.1 molecular chaperone DnaJ [Pararhodospirillum oryzae]
MTRADNTGWDRRRKRRPIPPLDSFGPQGAAKTRLCDHPGCTHEGLYRAPKSRDLREYYWFCLEHVQAYNKAWNYYDGLNETDIETMIRRATVWDRPTWPLGDRCAGVAERMHDPFTVFGPEGMAGEGPGQDSPRPRHREDGPRARAMRVMDLDEPLTLSALKTRYKTLVKRYHPDANGGDRDAEERFKMVTEAYHVLRAALGA